MSQTHHVVSDLARRAAHLARTSGAVPGTSQPSSNSESSGRSAIALGVVSTTLAALKEASGPVPALRQATGLAIVCLESVQVSTVLYIFDSQTHNSA
jgi:hypothetical protein